MESLSPPSVVQNAKEYKLESEDKIFKIKLSLSSNIIIEIHELNKIQGSFYIKEFSLDELVKISRGFKICENINDAYEILEDIFEAKKYSIKLKEDNSIILNINVFLPGGRTQSAELSLNKKEINKNVLIEELVKKVNTLEEENKKLKEEISEIKEWKNKKLEEISEIKEWKNKIEKLFKEEIKEKEKIEKLGIDSKIIDNSNDLNFLVNRLINNDQILKQKKIKFNLLYRATRDGDYSDDFHSKVDNKNSTLTIIKTTSGSKFGVFLEVPFKQTGNCVVDDKSFIFSLDLKKIYNSKKGQYVLNDYTVNKGTILDLNCQPIRIYNNCLSNNNSYTETKSNVSFRFSGFERDYELNNNQKNFTVTEMETYQIYFN